MVCSIRLSQYILKRQATVMPDVRCAQEILMAAAKTPDSILES